MSTHWHCQLDKDGVPIPDDDAQQKHLLSYVFWKTTTKLGQPVVDPNGKARGKAKQVEKTL